MHVLDLGVYQTVLPSILWQLCARGSRGVFKVPWHDFGLAQRPIDYTPKRSHT